MSMTTTMRSHLCCTAPRSGMSSPVPPYRPPTFNINDPLFALASLPADHPHAPTKVARMSFGEKMKDLEILRSPRLSDKVRMKIGKRKSKRDLDLEHVDEEEYDEDARVLGSREVLDGVVEVEVPERGSSKNIGLLTTADDHDLTELAFRVAARRPLTDSEDSLPRAVSSPMLLSDVLPWKPEREPIRRTKSYGVIGQALTTPDVKPRLNTGPLLAASTPRMRSRGKSNTSLSIGTILSKAIDDVMSPESKKVTPEKSTDQHEREKSVVRRDSPMMSSNNSSSSSLPARNAQLPLPPQPLERSESTHLDLAAIRGATRCISRGSTALSSDYNQEDVSEFLQSHRWNHNRSTTPDIVSQRHRRGQSSIIQQPSTIHGRLAAARQDVYSPSVYSRPGSADESRPGVPSRLDSALRGPEWPLANDTQHDSVKAQDKGNARDPPTSPVLSVRSLHEKPLPPTPESAKSTTKSPPKKTVKKRRSIFRFLRPGSRKGPGRAIRSISSPILLYRSTPVRHSGVFDGPADEITVQYELNENPQHRRSVTVGNVGTGYLSVPQERRGTLIDYERSLSVGGDDRRRRSSEQFNNSSRPSLVTTSASAKTGGQFQDFLEEDGHTDDLLQRAQSSSRLRRKLSRAHALDEAGVTLMGQALKKHQQEKALFRSESKRKESLAQNTATAQPSPLVFKESKWQKGSLPNMTLEEEDETIDPYEEGPKVGIPYRPSTEMRLSSLPASSRNASTPGSPPTDIPPPSTPARIGTSLSSWSRFPSHTRDERCASAGRADAVSTRDWAVGGNTIDIDKTPLSKHSTLKSTKRAASNLIKSPSQTFQKVVKYYSDLFTRDAGFHGGNRRTSVSASQGLVVHPELEMLAPVGVEHGPQRHEHWKHLKEVEERLFGDGEEKKVNGKAKEKDGEFRLVSEGTGFRQGSIFAVGAREVSGGSGEDEEEGPGGGLDGAAEKLSSMYQSTCLDRPGSGGEGEGERAQSRVRKYPSVTVMDDCRGHRASISLVAN